MSSQPDLPFGLPHWRKPEEPLPAPQEPPEPERSRWARICAWASRARLSIWWCLTHWKEISGAAAFIWGVFELTLLAMGAPAVGVGNYRFERKGGAPAQSVPTAVSEPDRDVTLRPWTIKTGSAK